MAGFRGLAAVGPPLFRPSEFAFFEYNDYMEKRQLFLRSYQFSRKQTTAERIRSTLVRVRRVVCVKLRAARRLFRRLVWLRLRGHVVGCGCGRRRRRFQYRLCRTLSAQTPSSGGGGGGGTADNNSFSWRSSSLWTSSS